MSDWRLCDCEGTCRLIGAGGVSPEMRARCKRTPLIEVPIDALESRIRQIIREELNRRFPPDQP